ncbi:MAG: hypothetical protein ACFHX7_05500 [Pseudomonadota bacterium]
MNSTATPAWGDISLAMHQWHQIDQLWVYLWQGSHEFGISYCYGEPARAPWLQYTSLAEMRFPINGSITAIQQLSTRPVVARPNLPIHLPTGESVTLYVGTSLWFTLQRDTDTLVDIPVARLSDTWFGPDTRQGEICYACGTHARLSMEGIRVNAFKAITPIHVQNESDKAIVIDRINLPVNYMTLFRDEQRHWTSALTIKRRATEANSQIHVADLPPDACVNPVIVAEPRKRLPDGILNKAMNLLLG